ncbi:MAG: NUDIX domain-containing protein [Candidatus Woesearchaeota archaeon]
MIRNIAAIILYDAKKKILLQHRDENIEHLPGYWAFFGGGIDLGETPEQAIIRETKEELDYDLKNPKLILVQKFEDKDYGGSKYVFMEENDTTKKLIQHEGQGMRWIRLQDADNLKIVHHDLKVLEFIKGKY